jgi:hypothetical protein
VSWGFLRRTRHYADGNFWIIGQVDDVINVLSHRHCMAEVESAIVSNERVAEGRPDRAQRGHRLGDHGIRHAELAPTTAKRRHKSASARSCVACYATSPSAKLGNVTTSRNQDLISQLEGKIKERQDEE